MSIKGNARTGRQRIGAAQDAPENPSAMVAKNKPRSRVARSPWWRRLLTFLFGAPAPAPGPRPRANRPRPSGSSNGASSGSASSGNDEASGSDFIRPIGGVGNLDASAKDVSLGEDQRGLLERVESSIHTGDFELPQLRSVSLRLMDMASKPNTELREVAQLISSDPSLSSELLKTANSVLYAAREPAATIHEAVMRLGLRDLRSMILSISMRGAVLQSRSLQRYAKEVWRQASSVANLSRFIGPYVGHDPDEAYLLGLLHDIGKVALLSMLSKEQRSQSDLASAIVGEVFRRYHEAAGVAMAREWKLSDETVSVCGCHHRYWENEDFPQSAAMVALAHKMDLFLSMGAREEYESLAEGEEAVYLGITADQMKQILARGQRTFEQTNAAAMKLAA